LAQQAGARVGVVLPAGGEEFRLTPQSVEIAGVTARRGAVLAGEELAGEPDLPLLDVLHANAPDAEAAVRAAERLAARDEVFALVGGLGAGQAQALAGVAQERGILFFNIGSTGDELRGLECGRQIFHLEASAAMYLDVMAARFGGERFLPWAIVHPDTAEGRLWSGAAIGALRAAVGEAGEVTPVAVPEVPVFEEAISAIRTASPGLVLLLLDWRQQLEFLGRYEAEELEFPITGFPAAATQTREFIVAAASSAPRAAAGERVALWSAALQGSGADELNRRFMARWGVIMDSPAWAAYAAVVCLGRAAAAAATTNAGRLIQWLESPAATFDLAKGVDLSFRAWDHQLRQPLYVLDIEPADAALASVVATFPERYREAAALDRLGRGLEESECRF
jgi:ABC-type branched-subunit amino acid transport system substrate-binding protein